jgi:MFS family permease
LSHPSHHIRQHWRRNWFAFLGDYLGFGVGLIFANTTTTLPAFAAALTDNKVLIGAVSSVWAGGWLLPQIFAAHYLSDKARKYPIMMKWQLIGRPAFPLFVVWLLLGGARYPALTLGLFLLAIIIFMSTDALVALSFLDLFGKAMPADRRGRLIGVGQVLTGLAAVGAGAVIQRVLGSNGPGFPMNYAIIFGLASLGFAFSTISCGLIVEAPEAVEARRPSLREYVPQLGRLWRDDRRFSLITLVRLLSGLGSLATTFYVVYATDWLHLPPAAVGLFAAAATVGTALAGLLLGVLADRYGSQRVVQVVTWAQFFVPVLALLCHLGVFGSAVNLVYPLLYVLLGVYDGSMMLGFLSFVLEIAPPGQRPTYLGLTNTLTGVLIVLPMLGGFLLQRTSYPLLFGLTALGTLSAALLALRLPNPRHDVSQVQAPASEPETQTAAVR